MSGPADVFDIRRLVESAVPLTAPTNPKNTHLLGLGLPKGKKYAVSGRDLYLPSTDDALKNLRSATAESILSMSEDEARWAFSALLRAPGMIVALDAPSTATLAASDIDIYGYEPAQVHSVGLAVVTSPIDQEMRPDGRISGNRTAGVAILTLLLDDAGRTEQAWLETRWTTSTRGLTQELELLYLQAPEATRARSRKRSAALIIDASTEPMIDDRARERLVVAAAVHGWDLRVIDRSKNTLANTKRSLTEESPELALFLSPNTHDTSELMKAHQSARLSGYCERIDCRDPANFISEGQELFARLSQINAALHPSTTIPPAPADVRAPMPFSDARRCLHDSSGRPYILNGKDGLWWTRDTAGHAGTVFKTYIVDNDRFKHDADLDKEGGLIEKHKGEVRDNFSVKILRGCAYPRSHLG